MSHDSVDPRQDYFDTLADRWDGFEDLEVLGPRLDRELEILGIGRSETVMDVGCGTGNLTLALLRRLGPDGRVLAVDIAPAMIEKARDKVRDDRVAWIQGALARLPLPACSVDRAMLLSVWPHVDDRAAAASELFRVLRPGGVANVVHLNSRSRINAIHAGVGGAIGQDLLPPADETARTLEAAGFLVTAQRDDDEGYLVSASRKESIR